MVKEQIDRRKILKNIYNIKNNVNCNKDEIKSTKIKLSKWITIKDTHLQNQFQIYL